MKIKFLVLLALSSVTMLSASCPGGNCPYQGQSQGYYPQAAGQTYYQNNPQYNPQYNPQGQNYYDNQNPQYRSSYSQYDQNQYNPNQYDNQGGYYNPSSMSNYPN